MRQLKAWGGCGLSSHAEKIMWPLREVALHWPGKINLPGSWLCWQNKCFCKGWDPSQVAGKLENISPWEQTGSLAVRVTDGFATREYFLEKSGQMVPSPRGEGFFILCCGQIAENPARFTLWGWRPSHPSQRGAQFLVPDTQSCSPWVNILWTSQGKQKGSVQCLFHEPFFLGVVLFYILATTLLNIIALIALVQLQPQH